MTCETLCRAGLKLRSPGWRSCVCVRVCVSLSTHNRAPPLSIFTFFFPVHPATVHHLFKIVQNVCWQLHNAFTLQPCASFPASKGSLQRQDVTARDCDQTYISEKLRMRTLYSILHEPHLIFFCISNVIRNRANGYVTVTWSSACNSNLGYIINSWSSMQWVCWMTVMSIGTEFKSMCISYSWNAHMLQFRFVRTTKVKINFDFHLH